MKYFTQKMDRNLALEILGWKYEPPYDFYSNEISEDSLRELLENPYRAVMDENEVLAGFYCSGASAQVPAGSPFGAYELTAIDVGIGMHPELTGKGNGRSFFSFVLDELHTAHPESNFRLTVADFNNRAIRLYENIGFKKVMEFPGSATRFITMVKMYKINAL